MHPVEMLGNLPGLVALDRPDEMPFQQQIGLGRLDRGHLVECFLQIILAESALPGLCSRHHGGRVEGLGDCQQLHRLRISQRYSGCGGDTVTHNLQVLGGLRT
ncbi:hypothetical protein ACFS07_05095 [Undibacterium arcticum]